MPSSQLWGLLILFFLFPSFGYCQSASYIANVVDSIIRYHCSSTIGNAKNKNIKVLNSLKNRSEIANESDFIDIDIFYQGKNDINLFSVNQFIEIDGIVKDIHTSKAESCNCNNNNRLMRDIHIKIVSQNYPNALPMIVEITPRSVMRKAENQVVWTTESLRKQIKGRLVRFQGWMFLDKEHIESSFNSQPNKKRHIWRQSAWEIHPVTDFQIIK